MEKVVSRIVGLGVPGLVLTVAIGATGLHGGAAILVALSSIGPGGIIGGIASLGVILLISQGISEFGIDAIFMAVVNELYRRGETKDSILSKVSKYPISKSLKAKIRFHLDYC